jgi:hypothetical protein
MLNCVLDCMLDCMLNCGLESVLDCGLSSKLELVEREVQGPNSLELLTVGLILAIGLIGAVPPHSQAAIIL